MLIILQIAPYQARVRPCRREMKCQWSLNFEAAAYVYRCRNGSEERTRKWVLLVTVMVYPPPSAELSMARRLSHLNRDVSGEPKNLMLLRRGPGRALVSNASDESKDAMLSAEFGLLEA